MAEIWNTLAIEHDGNVTVALGKSCKELNWQNRDIPWSALLTKFQTPKRTSETYSEYLSLPKPEQGARKDVGGFVGGVYPGVGEKQTLY